MKADFCVINPPFNGPDGQGMLHYDFLCKALEVAETVVSIQPATWMNQQKNRAGLPLNGRGATINIIQDTEHLFGDSNTNLGYNLSVSCFSSKYNDIRVDWGNGERTVYQDLESLDESDRYSLLKGILEKGNTLSDDRLLRHTYGSALGSVGGDTGKIKIRQNDLPSIAGKWIVQLATIIPNRERHPNNYGLFNIDPNKLIIYQHDGSPKFPACCCVFDTEQEARNCYAYLTSDLVRAYVIAYKKGSHVLQARPHIPWPATFDTDPALWTNEAISDRAGLDQKERQWLAEMLPDCYNIRKPAVSHDTAG